MKHHQLPLCLTLVVTLYLLASCPAPPQPLVVRQLPEKLQPFSYKAVWFDQGDANRLFVSRDYGLFQSLNGGRTWEELDLADSDFPLASCSATLAALETDTPSILALQALSNSRFLVSAEQLGVQIVQTDACTPSPMNLDLVVSLVTTPDRTVYLGTIFGQVASLSYGQDLPSVTRIFSGDESTVSLTVGPDQSIYALSDLGSVMVRASDQITWTSASLDFAIGGTNALLFNPDNQTWYIAADDVLYSRSINSSKWTKSAQKFDGEITNIVLNPDASSQMILATEFSLWRSVNYGENWENVLSQLLVATPTPTRTPTMPPPAHTPTMRVISTSTRPPTASPTNTLVPTATDTPTLVPTATNTPTLEPTATDTPTLEPTATDTPTLEPTATDTPTLEPTATDTSTAPLPSTVPVATTSNVPTQSGAYCVFLEKEQPVKVGDRLRLLIVVSGTDVPEEPPSGYNIRDTLGCGVIDMHSRMRWRIYDAIVENQGAFVECREVDPINDNIWEADLRFERPPQGFAIQLSNSCLDTWVDLRLEKLPIVEETLVSRVGFVPIAVVVAATIGVAVTLVVGAKKRKSQASA